MLEDITLTFSDEEWLGLAAWQRELYRTVMKDTTELFTSLGVMFLRRDELQVPENQPTQDSTGERNVITTHPAVNEEITRENGFIQVTETSVFQEDPGKSISTVSVEAAEMNQCPGNHLITPNPEASSVKETFFPQRAVKPVIPENLEEHFIHENTQISTLQEGMRQGYIAWHTETGSDELLPTRNTEEITYLKDGASGEPGDVICDSRVDLVIESDEQIFTSDIFPDSDYLTIIQVEEINVALEKEVKTTYKDGWDMYPDDNIVLWKNIETLQEQAAFPLALMGPQNRTNYQYPQIHTADTSQWSEQIQLENCLHVTEGGAMATPVSFQITEMVELDETKTQESLLGESLYKCSICCKSFFHKLHFEHHVQGHMEKMTFTCPTCYRHFINNHYLQEHEGTHHTPFHGDSPSRTIDQAKQTTQKFLCTQCNRRFSQLVGLHRHQKVHTRNKILPRAITPPARKVYKLPLLHPSAGGKTEPKADPSGEAFTKLHQHLQLSTAFLQNLITSTCGFQYD